MVRKERTNNWLRKGVVIEATDAADEDNTFEPTVIRDANPQILTQYDTVFKIWYTSGWSNPNINYAESVDGITWSEPTRAVVSGHARSYVFKDGSTYYMYAALTAAGTQIDKFTSSDGVTWSAYGSNPVITRGGSGTWNEGSVQNCFVWIEGGTWYMILEGSVPASTSYTLGLYTSADGNSWTQNGGNPVLGGLSQGGPYVKKVGSTYYMWVHTGSLSSILPSQLSRYSSTNLTSWTSQGVVLERRQADEGANTLYGQIADPTYIEVDSSVYVFYAASTDGSAQAGTQKIKLAVLHLPFSEIIYSAEGDRGDIAPLTSTTVYESFFTETGDEITYSKAGNTGIRAYGTGTAVAYFDAESSAGVISRLQSSLSDGWAGTLSNHPFSLYANSIEALKISTAGAIQFPEITGGAGQYLAVDASGNVTAGTPSSSSQWTTTGSDIYFGGKISVAHTAAPLQVIDAIVSANSSQSIGIQNTNTVGGNAAAVFLARNDTYGASYGMSGNGYSTYGALQANNAFLYTSADMVFMSDNVTGDIRFATGGSVQKMELSASGALQLNAYGAGTLVTDGSGNVTASSDARLKNIQAKYTTGLDAVLGLNPVTYKWNEKSGLDTKETYAGFIAQNVKANIPFGTGVGQDGMLTLQDRAIAAALVNAIKELNAKIEKLEAELKKK